MSARKPLARMESPATLDLSESVQQMKETLSNEGSLGEKTSHNGNNVEVVTTKNEHIEKANIKQEQDPESKILTETQMLSCLEPKRITRNSPMLLASPVKKISTDSQEQLSESGSITDEATKNKDKHDKPQISRVRKQQDANNKASGKPPTNRLTRKAAMEDWAANTRLTRARRVSCGLNSSRSETPPKRKYVFKNKVDPTVQAEKRKRSISPKSAADGPESKMTKIDDQNPTFDINSVIIKQEILESSEEMTSDVASDITDLFQAEPSPRISLRARKKEMCYSPTTRAYRKDKSKTETCSQGTTRKRMSRVRPDEDSKDSITSSIVDELVLVVKTEPEDLNETNLVTPETDIVGSRGIEKPITTESQDSDDALLASADLPLTDDNVTVKPLSAENLESDDRAPTKQIADSNAISHNVRATEINKPNFVDTTESNTTPLTVDTSETKSQTQMPSTSAAVSSDQSNSSDKSASLSPEMVSEGVSEMSVKQFYKKPEFLENNLGIENDPKLGEIVQTVSEKLDDTVDKTSLSNESIKEGELVFEAEDEDVESIGTIKNENEDDEDVNSVSTGFISPLLVEEEDEDEEMQTALTGEENIEETSNADDLEVANEQEDSVHIEIDDNTKEKTDSSKEDQKEIKGAEMNADFLIEIQEDISKDVQKIVQEKIEETIQVKTKEETVFQPPGNGSAEEIVSETNETLLETKPELVKKLEVKKHVKDIKKEEPLDNGDKMDFIVDKKEVVVEKMELDIPKIEDIKTDEIILDQEENKENVQIEAEVLPEPAKSPERDSSALVPTEDQTESTSESSKNTSPVKNNVETSCEAPSSSSTSPQSSKASSIPRTPENDEKLRQKERHLKTLGLLTHKAADEAIMAKQKRRKFLHNLSNNSSKKKNNDTNSTGNAQKKSSQEYTGTLKTIIKINRQSNDNTSGNPANEPKKGKNAETKATTSGYGNRRQSLKMTFQKGRGRPANTEKSGENPANTSGEDSYYTIQNEGGSTTTQTTAALSAGEQSSTTAPATTTAASHGRKSYNRSNTTDPNPQDENHEAPVANKKEEKEKILIPEKASSFKFHPGRLCQDQCYYCSGKFGLYDTPCHVGQIKSVDRQQKILANEEKLTVDNCLCDACFRHVDRRANVPSYKKRHSVPGRIETTTTETVQEETPTEQEKPKQPSQINGSQATNTHMCAVPDCGEKAAHSLRRKTIRKNIKKSLLNFDMSTAGTYLHICEKHYDAVIQSSGCVLCKRRLGKNNMYHITTDTDRLEKALADMGIPVVMGQCTAVCKLCRYFANLLMKPPEHGKVQKLEFVKNYRKRLLQFYNIHDKSNISHEDDEHSGKDKPKSKKESAKRKSSSQPENTEKPVEETKPPPSPSHSTGSSVEIVSDGGMFSSDEAIQSATNISSATATTVNAPINQMILDNDVMVDYDVPIISDSSSVGSSKSTSPSPPRSKHSKEQQSKLKAILQSVGTSLEDRSDISTALRSNPNISMRELFPGEEDLGLQFKAPFGSSTSQRTPEGWTRVNTFLQYDEPTRRLWENLQKPYGNQSSFLRHLILLEKYYRNGDLILSSNASSNATVYTQTVRNRLTSFDSRCSSPSSSPDNEETTSRSRSLSVDKIQRQLSSNSVTIIARPKDAKPQPKDNETAKQEKIPKDLPSPSVSAPIPTNSRSILKTNLIAPKSVEIVPLSAPSSTSSSPKSPSGSSTQNDGTALTKQQKILAAANKLMSNKQEVSPVHKKTSLNTTPPELISLNKRPVTAVQVQQTKRPQLLPKPMKMNPPNVVVLPDTLTVQERLESKSWRPTLLPVVSTSHHLNNQSGPLYQTADGRRLPALVQVQSGGRPFLISIHDYNRMCILRREKLMRDQMLKSKSKQKSSVFPPATCTTSKPTSTNTALTSFSKAMQAVNSGENLAKKQRLSGGKVTQYTPIAPKPLPSSTATSSSSSISTSQSKPSMIIPGGTLQPINLITQPQNAGISIIPNYTSQMLSTLKPSTATATSVSGVPTSSWLWNNFPDPNQMLINGKSSSTSTTKGPQATLTSIKQQQSLLLDNNLMSKIPKSLTVIPQHKLMPAAPSGVQSGGMPGNMSKD